MAIVTDILGLIKDLMDKAKENKNELLYSDLITIEEQVYELGLENRKLKEQLEIREKQIYDENTNTFVLPPRSDIHYCSVCYGNNRKLIPVQKGKRCLICQMNWINAQSLTRSE